MIDRKSAITENEAPRTLIVDLSLWLGGASIRALSLLEHIPRDRGLLAGITGSEVMERARQRGVRHFPVGVTKVDPWIAHRLRKLIRMQQFEVIDTQNAQSKLWGSLAASRTKAALVSTLNSWYTDEHEGRTRGRFYQAIEHYTTPQTDHFIVVSRAIRNHLLQAGVDVSCVSLIPNAVTLDVEQFARPRHEILQSLGLAAENRLIVAVGRLVEAKGYSILIEAAQNLPPTTTIVIIGDGHLRPGLQAQIKAMNCENRVRLLGFMPREKLLEIVAASCIFTMPSLTEGTPIALLEAAALARPIVASLVGGIPEIIVHDQHGLLVKPGDPVALSNAIIYLLEHPETKFRLGQAAQAHIRAEFSLEAQHTKTIAAYHHAVVARQVREERQRARGLLKTR